MQIKVQTPAKINLTLEVLNKRPDGFHNIQSIMHTISLCDFLTIKISPSTTTENEIILTGTSDKIPYDERNIVYKAAKLYFAAANIKSKKVSIHIEKHIPVSAGLAGGSTNASGTLFGLNEIFEKELSDEKLHLLASQLGSDLNFCLNGGCALCTSRGEVIEKLPPAKFNISLIKPKNLGISAKEAYQKFALLADKSHPDNTSKLNDLLLKNEFDKMLIYNSLEKAILPDYEILREIKRRVIGSTMSGSGPTFFVIDKEFGTEWNKNEFDIFNNLTSVNFGAKTV